MKEVFQESGKILKATQFWKITVKNGERIWNDSLRRKPGVSLLWRKAGILLRLG